VAVASLARGSLLCTTWTSHPSSGSRGKIKWVRIKSAPPTKLGQISSGVDNSPHPSSPWGHFAAGAERVISLPEILRRPKPPTIAASRGKLSTSPLIRTSYRTHHPSVRRSRRDIPSSGAEGAGARRQPIDHYQPQRIPGKPPFYAGRRPILLARIFGPIEPAGWIVKGLAHANRAGREPYALGWASCPGFAHQYNPVRANPPFGAA
jgi:hypothetical protein